MDLFYRAGLSLGSSKHWKDVLEAITGERDYDASAILEYFKPLQEVLDKTESPTESSTISTVLPYIIAAVFILVLIVGLIYIGYKKIASRKR